MNLWQFVYTASDWKFLPFPQKSSGKDLLAHITKKFLPFRGPSLSMSQGPICSRWLRSPTGLGFYNMTLAAPSLTYFLHLTLWNTAEPSVSALPRKVPTLGLRMGKMWKWICDSLGFTIHIFNYPVCLPIILWLHGEYKDLTTVDSHFLPLFFMLLLHALLCFLNPFLLVPFYPTPPSPGTCGQLLDYILSLGWFALFKYYTDGII